MGGKLLNGMKSMYVNSLTCVRVNEVRVSVLGSIVMRDRSVSCRLGSSMYIWTN